jgi:hypothetical protein
MIVKVSIKKKEIENSIKEIKQFNPINNELADFFCANITISNDNCEFNFYGNFFMFANHLYGGIDALRRKKFLKYKKVGAFDAENYTYEIDLKKDKIYLKETHNKRGIIEDKCADCIMEMDEISMIPQFVNCIEKTLNKIKSIDSTFFENSPFINEVKDFQLDLKSQMK